MLICGALVVCLLSSVPMSPLVQGELAPDALVQLSTTELASRQLSAWRQQKEEEFAKAKFLDEGGWVDVTKPCQTFNCLSSLPGHVIVKRSSEWMAVHARAASLICLKFSSEWIAVHARAASLILFHFCITVTRLQLLRSSCTWEFHCTCPAELCTSLRPTVPHHELCHPRQA